MRQLVDQTLSMFKQRATRVPSIPVEEERVVLKTTAVDFVGKSGVQISCELSGAASCRTIISDEAAVAVDTGGSSGPGVAPGMLGAAAGAAVEAAQVRKGGGGRGGGAGGDSPCAVEGRLTPT